MRREHTKPLTRQQRRALEHLARNPDEHPAGLGEAIWEPGVNRPRGVGLKAQGYGRLGGTMLWRLRRMGLAEARHTPSGWLVGWRITPDGRAALGSSVLLPDEAAQLLSLGEVPGLFRCEGWVPVTELAEGRFLVTTWGGEPTIWTIVRQRPTPDASMDVLDADGTALAAPVYYTRMRT
jgi:hypothetical protein